MKKIAATILCLGMAISTLCACSSTGTSGEQPVEEPATKQTEAVTETTETPSEQPIESETTEQPVPEGDVIIPLYCEYREDEIRPLLNTTRPVDDVTNLNNFDMFCYYFAPVTPTGNDWNGLPTYTIGAGTTFSLAGTSSAERTDVSLYFFAGGENDDKTSICFEADSKTGATGGFIPLWYNQTQGCIVGYSVINEDGVISYSLREIIYFADTLASRDLTSDPSIYGF